MLGIAKIDAGPRAGQYYIDQVALGKDDYYAGKREDPGTWVGTSAADLQLEGDVDIDAFRHLLNGAGRRKPMKEGAVGGIDLTFRAPKSVSVLWAVGGPELADQLQAAHDIAVREALGYLERQACWGRRGAGGKVQVKGGGFIGAAFVHRASRAGDPLLHTHVVVGNVTQGPDGRWTALDARHLYRQSKAAGYLYQAALRAEVTDRTGLEWTKVDNGVADLTVVDRRVIEHFSQRRTEILEHMAAHGGHSATSAQVAALETRRAKDEPPLAQQLADWRARAAEFGLTVDRVHEVADGGSRERGLPQHVEIESLTEQRSTFGRAEVVQAIAAAQPDGAHVRDIEVLVDGALRDPDVLELVDGTAAAGVQEARYSTRGLVETETRLLTLAESRRSDAPQVDERDLDHALEARTTLSTEQRDVIHGLTRGTEGVTVLRAAAGTGKTFVLDAARDAWEAQGLPVVGCALSARAARELQDLSTIPSQTIAAVRRELEHGYELPDRVVLVVDEAGMVGTRALAELADATTRARGRLVLVGDDRQLPEIQAGGAFRSLAAQPGTLELREVRRQREPWDRAALDALRSGEVERWARTYRHHGRITIGQTAPDTRAALINDWARADGDRLVIAARRSDTRDLNDRARQLLKADGTLGPDEIDTCGRGFTTGDQILTTRNDHRLHVLNGQRGTVTAIDRDTRTITVELAGETRTLDAAYLDAGHVDHGYAVTAHRAQGATVDRAFVLGSDELYRELGYTALSRHRDSARFYITEHDLGHHDQLAPDRDPFVDGITRLLTRSRAQDLARDQLADLDDDQLKREHDELLEKLIADPPPDPKQRDELGPDPLTEVRERIERLLEEREHTPFWARGTRRELDERIDAQQQALVRHTATRDRVAGLDRAAPGGGEDWLTRSGSVGERYLAATEERRARATARERLDGHHRLAGRDLDQRSLDDLIHPDNRNDPWHSPSRTHKPLGLDRGLDL